MIDLRSDTVTKPTPAMWDVMNRAPVGDDVFGEDPGLNLLEEKIAALFGMSAGLFVPSGTMGNQLAIKMHTSPADEVIIDSNAHVFHSEGAAASVISGIQFHPLRGERGILKARQIEQAIHPITDWDPRSRLIALENTSNRGGGTCYPEAVIREIHDMARKHHLALHMDGARIWNASVATGIPLHEFGALCDTISVCFSKGLGAPVGSMLLGSSEIIRRARRFRKILGGGMRQAGMLAAAAGFAVDNHLPLLAEDHRRARTLADALAASDAFEIDPVHVQTNIVLFHATGGLVEKALTWFEQNRIAMIPFGGDTIRATFHFEINDEDLDQVIDAVMRYKA